MAEDTKKTTEDASTSSAPKTETPEVKEEKKVEETKPVEDSSTSSVSSTETETKEEKVEEEPEETLRELPDFRVGDTIRIMYKIIEGDKQRLQPFEGIVISKRGAGLSKSFMVRKIASDNIGVERIFQYYSPNIADLKVVKKGKVRRAKLYYLRNKKGRAAMRIKERK